MTIRNLIMRLGTAACFFLAAAAQATQGGAKAIGVNATTGGAQAVIVDENAALVHTAQLFPRNYRAPTGLPPNAARQANQVLEHLELVLKPAASQLADVVKLNVYLANESSLPEVREAIVKNFAKAELPAISYVAGNLAEPGVLVAMDAVSVCALPANVVARLSPDDPVGFASTAVLPAGPKIYISGMADTNSLLPATSKTLEKLVAVLGHLGSKTEDIAQLKVFLQPMSEVAAVRKEIAKFFNGKAPPTVFVDWISANPVVEIELIARADDRLVKDTDSVSYLTPPGTTGSKVYSRVARVNRGKVIYFSGLYGMKAKDGAGQVQEIFSTLSEVAKATGTDLEHLVKATYYVSDEAASKALNDLRPKYYNPQRPPAASKAKVKGVGVAGRTVTLDMIAVTK